MDSLDDILIKHSWPIKTISDNVDVGGSEAKIGFELPSDYKDFISKYTGHETQMGQQFGVLINIVIFKKFCHGSHITTGRSWHSASLHCQALLSPPVTNTGR